MRARETDRQTEGKRRTRKLGKPIRDRIGFRGREINVFVDRY